MLDWLRKYKRFLILGMGGLSVLLLVKLCIDVKPVPENIHIVQDDFKKVRLLDRDGEILTLTYQNKWNSSHNLSLNKVPEFLQNAFILSEDKNFYRHHGVDYGARLHALWQNVRSLSFVRGGSTITEQVIKMLHPRRRSIWARVVEGFEAHKLERKNDKLGIFAFYLNQVPYTANRRGIYQASLYYFNRDLETLSPREMLALTVLVRAPSAYDIYKNPQRIEGLIQNLAVKMYAQDYLSQTVLDDIQLKKDFVLDKTALSIEAPHFTNFVFEKIAQAGKGGREKVSTTLDADLQKFVQNALDKRMETLHKNNVKNAAVLVVNNKKNEIRAWAVAGNKMKKNEGGDFNAALIPRQPGSSLKPFLYALALKKGMTAATIIDDKALSTKVGTGLHRFKNYSEQFYGKITLREALGNSLNIPALKVLDFVGVEPYVAFLRDRLRMSSLTESPHFYGEGIALGSAEISLFNMVQAYTVLARKGRFLPLKFLLESPSVEEEQVFSKDVSSLIADILSDPTARVKEFGFNNVLNFSSRAAAKTGTSSDYRDAWVFAFNNDYTIGIWMGNLSGTPTDGLTGAKGPALLVRSILTELERRDPSSGGLYRSPRLLQKDICRMEDEFFLANKKCASRSEYFIQGFEPKPASEFIEKSLQKKTFSPEIIQFKKPTDGLEIAIDKRVPLSSQAFVFEVKNMDLDAGCYVRWILNGQAIAETAGASYTWDLKKGEHVLSAEILHHSQVVKTLYPLGFIVK
ncbi:MAG: transglycosylase domain-containing protein [Alphaproteobacteria bacterium]